MIMKPELVMLGKNQNPRSKFDTDGNACDKDCVKNSE